MHSFHMSRYKCISTNIITVKFSANFLFNISLLFAKVAEKVFTSAIGCKLSIIMELNEDDILFLKKDLKQRDRKKHMYENMVI